MDDLAPKRLVWKTGGEVPGGFEKEGPAGINDKLRALELKVAWRPGGRDKSRAVEDYKKRLQDGTETPYEPEKVPDMDMKKPINPTPENLKYLKGELQKKFNETFPMRYASKFSSEVTEKYVRLLRDLPEGFLMKAVTENGSPEELLDEFERQITVIRTMADQNIGPAIIWQKIKEFIHWVFDVGEWEAEGDNPNLDNIENPKNDTVKPRHKTSLANELKKLETYYRERLEDVHGHWYGDSYDDDKVDFLEDEEIPFYREFFLNKAILDKPPHTAYKLAVDYSKFLRDSYRECIDDEYKRRNQEVADNTLEDNERQAKAEWTDPRDRMIEHVKH